MSGIVADVLIDSDVWIDHIGGQWEIVSDDGISYSVITRCELLAGKGVDPQLIEDTLEPFTEFAIGREEANLAGELRRRHSMRTPDALIAATAIQHNLILITRNKRDFQKIRELQLHSPR